MTRYMQVPSPIGTLLLTGNGRALTGVHMFPHPPGLTTDAMEDPGDRLLAEAAAQLDAYFRGMLRAFSLPLAPQGTAFQRRVWEALGTIPYGETRSYGAIASAIGSPGASRAVGLANGRNPIAVITPCHRVIGADGSLTGYGGGLARKRWLLDLEAGHPPLPLGVPGDRGDVVAEGGCRGG